MLKTKADKIFLILQIATLSVFIGRAWQHLFWDAPYRALFWDASWMSGFVERFTNYNWQEYVTSPVVDDFIQRLIFFSGCFYLFCALGVLLIKKLPKLLVRIILISGAVALVLLALLYTKEKFFHIGQFLEFSAQFSAPIFLFLFFFQKINQERLILMLKIVIALTFISHGLYALNYYPRPGYFVQMVISILGVSESNAILFLNVAGILDFAVGIGIFLKGRIVLWTLWYAVFWGFCTAMARIWAHFHFDFWTESLHQWTYETIYRFPHFLLPLLAIFLISGKITFLSRRDDI